MFRYWAAQHSMRVLAVCELTTKTLTPTPLSQAHPLHTLIRNLSLSLSLSRSLSRSLRVPAYAWLSGPIRCRHIVRLKRVLYCTVLYCTILWCVYLFFRFDSDVLWCDVTHCTFWSHTKDHKSVPTPYYLNNNLLLPPYALVLTKY